MHRGGVAFFVKEFSCGCDPRSFSLCLRIARLGCLYQSDIFLDVLPARRSKPAYVLFRRRIGFLLGEVEAVSFWVRLERVTTEETGCDIRSIV